MLSLRYTTFVSPLPRLPQGSKDLNLRYLRNTLLTMPNLETIDTPHLDTSNL